jgi:hypothetical protein
LRQEAKTAEERAFEISKNEDKNREIALNEVLLKRSDPPASNRKSCPKSP